MLRRVLTVYLAVLTAAAPCLCCCTTGRLLAAAMPVRSTPQPEAPCCCHEVDSPIESEPGDPQAGTPPPNTPAPEQRCPCRDHSDMQAQVTVAPAITAELALLRAVLDAAPVALPAVESPAVLLEALLPPEPFPSAADLLNAESGAVTRREVERD